MHSADKPSAITIVIPVYGDWPSLHECIESLKKHVKAGSAKVIFVNDCGPDADLIERNIQKTVKALPGYEYHRNTKNLGFVKTCNRAVLELDKSGNDILLLNSDTKVTKGFLEEMTAVLHGSAKIAAVCPRSNNATVFSVPITAAADNTYPMQNSYRIFKKINKRLPRMYESPVAHGFCMLIRRSVIDDYGLFDEVYGKGYGEENDFCMRVRGHGYTCAVANRAFVFHFRAKSFTPEKRDALVAKNEKTLDKRYPGYRKLVDDYVKNLDPIEWSQDQARPPFSQLLDAASRLFR